MRVPGGGRLLPGLRGSGTLPPPTARPLGPAAGAHYPLAVGAGAAGVGTRHQPHSARSCEPALPALGAACGCSGGVPLAWVLGVRGRALSHARPLVLSGVRPGPTTHWLWVQRLRAWGSVTNPTARALASWLCALWGRHESARGGRLLPVCGSSGDGRSPTPDHSSFRACGRGSLPTGCGWAVQAWGTGCPWHLLLCRGSSCVVRASRVPGTRWPLWLGTCRHTLVVAGGVPLWRASWPRLPLFATPRSVHHLAAVAAGAYPPRGPPNAWSPRVPAPPGPCYLLVASGTPVGWRRGCLAVGLVHGAVRHYCLGGCSAPVVCSRRSRPVRGGWGRCRALCLPRFPLPASRFPRCVWRAVPSGCPLSSLAGTPLHAVRAFRGLGPVALLAFPACPLCVCVLVLLPPPPPPPLPWLVWRAHLARSRCPS